MAQKNTFVAEITFKDMVLLKVSQREKCPYSEFFWFVFSHIRTRKTPNTDTFCVVNTFVWGMNLRVHNLFDTFILDRAPSKNYANPIISYISCE